MVGWPYMTGEPPVVVSILLFFKSPFGFPASLYSKKTTYGSPLLTSSLTMSSQALEVSTPGPSIGNLPLEIHQLIFEFATTSSQPILINPKSPSQEDHQPALPPSISPLYTSSLTLPLLRPFFSQNTFLLSRTASLHALLRSAGPTHSKLILHIAFPASSRGVWYALLAGALPGLRSVTLCDVEANPRSFATVYGPMAAGRGAAATVQESRREGTDTAESPRSAEEGYDVELLPLTGAGEGREVSDVEARRFVEMLFAERPQVAEIRFGCVRVDGSLDTGTGPGGKELEALVGRLREKDPLSGGGGGGKDEEMVLGLKDWELLWEQAVMDDMKAWARGADDGMRAKLRREGWMLRMECLRRLRCDEEVREEVRARWKLSGFERWCQGFERLVERV